MEVPNWCNGPPKNCSCRTHPHAGFKEVASAEKTRSPISIRITIKVCESCRANKFDRNFIAVVMAKSELSNGSNVCASRIFPSAEKMDKWLRNWPRKLEQALLDSEDHEDRSTFKEGILPDLFFSVKHRIEEQIQREVNFSS